MNPRQRRGLLLIVLSALGASAVFVAVVNYVGEVNRRVGPMVPVVRLTAEAPAWQEVTADMVQEVEVPQRWGPPNALRTAADLQGNVPTVPLPAGTVLQQGMLVPAPVLRDGEREIAILVDAETGVAGKIGSGSVVDIYATFDAEVEGQPEAEVVVQDAEIIEVGTPTTLPDENADGGFGEGEFVPVTFALSVQESLTIAYVESFAANVRLALRAPTDDRPLGDGERVYRRPGPPAPAGPAAAAGG